MTKKIFVLMTTNFMNFFIQVYVLGNYLYFMFILILKSLLLTLLSCFMFMFSVIFIYYHFKLNLLLLDLFEAKLESNSFLLALFYDHIF